MSFFKHVGTANGTKKVIIVQRQLPGEEHMASVIFSEIIPSRFHDDVMKELESSAGQASDNFIDVLRRRYFSDGQNMLEALHAEGYIKKVAANNIIVKPNSKSAVRLDELNRMISEIRQGKLAQEELKAVEEIEAIESSKPANKIVTEATAEDDRIAKLEAMIMGLAQTVQSLATPAKASKSKKSA